MLHTQTFSERDYVPTTLRNDTGPQEHAKLFCPYKEHVHVLSYQDLGVALGPMHLKLIFSHNVVVKVHI